MTENRQKPGLEHVRLPQAHVYCGGQSLPFRPGEKLLLPADHAQDLRARGHQVEPADDAAAVAASEAVPVSPAPPEPEHR